MDQTNPTSRVTTNAISALGHQGLTRERRICGAGYSPPLWTNHPLKRQKVQIKA